MRYKIIKIEQHPGTHDFKSGVFEIGGDRVFSEQEPNPLGHFIIPNVFPSHDTVALGRLRVLSSPLAQRRLLPISARRQIAFPLSRDLSSNVCFSAGSLALRKPSTSLDD